MPLLGLIPFLHSKKQKKRMEESCVNALTRAYPISTKKGSKEAAKSIMCQCPYSGLSHFYLSLRTLSLRTLSCVNALTRAYPISTQEQSIQQ